MFCPHCGHPVTKESMFCVQCGKQIFMEHNTVAIPSGNSSSYAEQVSDSMVYKEKAAGMSNWIPLVESVLSRANIAVPNVRFVQNPAYQRMIISILGAHSLYYMQSFQRILSSGQCNINWMSLIFGIAHAAYKNVWREWLIAMKYPVVAYLGCQVLTILAWIAELSTSALILSGLSSLLAFWIFIWQIRIAMRFDKIYLIHVEDKIAANDQTPDDNGGRMALIVFVWFAVSGILYMLLESVAVPIFDF